MPMTGLRRAASAQLRWRFSELTVHDWAPQVPRLHLEPAGPPPPGTPVSAPVPFGTVLASNYAGNYTVGDSEAPGSPVFSAALRPFGGAAPLFNGSLQLNDLPRSSAMTRSQDRSPRASVPSAAAFQIETPFSTDPESAKQPTLVPLRVWLGGVWSPGLQTACMEPRLMTSGHPRHRRKGAAAE